MGLSLKSLLDEVDHALDQVKMQIERATPLDPELGAGVAAGDLDGTQKAVDVAYIRVEDLDYHIRDVARMRDRSF